MAGWFKLNCAIHTDSVKIQNVKIDMYPDATIGCIKHYLLAEIIKSGHQFVMRNFDDLRIVLVREADVYESDKRDGTLMICSWSASSECDYDRITQTAQFRRSRKASGGDWEVSLLICTKSHAEAQEEAKKEQEAQERSKKRPCGTKGHVDPEDKRVREIENRIPASAEQPAAVQGSEPVDFGKPHAWICTKLHAEAPEEERQVQQGQNIIGARTDREKE